MAELSKRFQEIMNDIQKNIKDEKELEYVNKKITELSMLYVESMEQMASILKDKIENVEKSQKSIEAKLNTMQSSITGIENDIYEEGYDFEIICPYCNTEFVADIESKNEIKCPECQNTIELDWTGGEEQNQCSGHCTSCNSRCGSSFFDEFGSDINFIEEDNDEDEDM